MLQNEYYVIERENNNNHPLLSWDQKRGRYGLGKPVGENGPVRFRLGEPVPEHIEWADYHPAPNPVISPRVANVLAPLDLYGVELVPALVGNPNDPFAEPRDYYLMHVWNHIHCIDFEQSDLELYDDGDILNINKMVLDNDTLARFDPRKRMKLSVEMAADVLISWLAVSILPTIKSWFHSLILL